MKILNAEQTRLADAYTIENEPIMSIDLMERASEMCVRHLLKICGNKNRFVIFAGTGNNGGDGLAIARLLSKMGNQLSVYMVLFTNKLSVDCVMNKERLLNETSVFYSEIENIDNFPDSISDNDVIIDAIFGYGLSRPVEGLAKLVITKINELPNCVISVDCPSGLFTEENNPANQIIVKANHTLTFQTPFLAFLFPENASYTGELHVLDIKLHPGFLNEVPSNYYFIQNDMIKSLIVRREKFDHKGSFGHALIVAGSKYKAGAALLAAKACSVSGAGLVTAHIPDNLGLAFNISCPEVMLVTDSHSDYMTHVNIPEKINAIGIGPGIGFNEETVAAVEQLISESKYPMVVDADALTILSMHPEWIQKLPENSILTPHPGEFDRLFGKSVNNYHRNKLQISISVTYKLYVILKGAYTALSCPDGCCYFNSTGNPGMANGGSGDVLTGILTGLLAQKYSPLNACLIGVYLHGLAADIALKNNSGYSIVASDIISNFQNAAGYCITN